MKKFNKIMIELRKQFTDRNRCEKCHQGNAALVGLRIEPIQKKHNIQIVTNIIVITVLQSIFQLKISKNK